MSKQTNRALVLSRYRYSQIFSKQAFRFLNAKGNFCFHLSVKDINLKPDILDPITDTLEVELGKLLDSTIPDDPVFQGIDRSVT